MAVTRCCLPTDTGYGLDCSWLPLRSTVFVLSFVKKVFLDRGEGICAVGPTQNTCQIDRVTADINTNQHCY